MKKILLALISVLLGTGSGFYGEFKNILKKIKAAKQGDAYAQNNLGSMYRSGKGTMQDYKQAMYWYKKAAEQENAQVQNNFGSMYDNGQKVLRGYRQAMYWYKKAAEQRLAQAFNT